MSKVLLQTFWPETRVSSVAEKWSKTPEVQDIDCLKFSFPSDSEDWKKVRES